jgi:carboxyl-terminal processing protease
MVTISFEKKWILVLILFQLSVILAAFTGGLLADRWMVSTQEDFPVLREAFEILQNHALFELPPVSKIEYGMIRGMIGTLNDPYTNFIEPPQHELQSQQLAGQYGGIGVQIETSSDGYFLLYPYPDSPAQLAGIIDGDRLVSVDRWEVAPDSTTDEVEAALRGEQGQTVSLVVLRKPRNDLLTFSIRRDRIAIPSVTWYLTDENEQVGLVRVHIIAKTTAGEILEAVQDLQSRGATALILDLRGNSGGLVEAGVDIARLFLRSGTVIEQQYRDQPVKVYQVERAGVLADIPMVMLVNSGTASAAEIVAGSLQAQNRAYLVGSPTFGKDTIQLVFDLKDKSSLHVTSARWWIPGFAELSKRQIQPDILVPEDELHTSVILHEAVKILVQ